MRINSEYTTYFNLHDAVVSITPEAKPLHMTETKVYTDDELLQQLNEMFEGISNITEYEQLIDILKNMKSRITLRFLYILFEALAVVEVRVWASEGMEIPILDIFYDAQEYLLDECEAFIYNYEKSIIDWTKENGYFNDDEKYKFIHRRNQIYSEYAMIARDVLEGNFTNDSDSNSNI